MIQHSQDVVQLLLWLVVSVGASLLSLLVWIGQRLQRKVDELPGHVTKQVAELHESMLAQMMTMNATHAKLEHDIRQQVTDMDRRVTVVEVRCGMHHVNHPPFTPS